jgi:hypothetical protein
VECALSKAVESAKNGAPGHRKTVWLISEY